MALCFCRQCENEAQHTACEPHLLNQVDLSFEEYQQMKENKVALTERMRVIMEVKEQENIANKEEQAMHGELIPASQQQSAQPKNAGKNIYWIEFLNFWDEEKSALLIPGA